MANVIKPKRSNTASAVPTTGQLTGGEIAVNMADRKIWINNGTAVVQVGAGNLGALSDVTITTPANGEVLQYNTSTSKWQNSVVSATNATNLSGGTTNQIPYQTGVSTTGFITAPVTGDTYLKWTGSAFSWASVSGTGDMAKATYDTNNNGKVDSAETADAIPWTGITSKPTFATVATSGLYSDLSGTPVIGTNIQAWSSNLDNWSAISTTSKQATLVSGTNIKTINSTSLLGSGDVTVQPTLVSGTNIKTVNGTSLLGSGDLVISGGSGSPGGSDTHIQYNSSGTFGGSANFAYNVGTNRLHLIGTDAEFELQSITTEPAAPSAGRLLLYAKSIGGRMLPKFMGPSGYDTAVQASIAQNKVAMYNPQGNSNTVPVVFGFNLTPNGTAQPRTVATTNVFTRAKRIGYQSAATAGQYTGLYNLAAGNQYTVGTNTVGIGGFYFVIRFGFAVVIASQISFIGLTNTVTVPGVAVDPATFINSIGVGTSAGDTNLRLFYGGTAAQTPIALGASFPGKVANTDWYELILFAPSNVNNVVNYRIQNITTGVIAEGTITAATPGTQLPSSTTLLGVRAFTSNNATATAVAMDFGTIYMETDT